MKKMILNGLLAAAFLAPVAFAGTAHADYCREYQKSIRVNGRIENGYGTACLQPDGSWMIVNSGGSVDPFDQLRAQNVNIIAREQPVYYTYGPAYRPVTYYVPARYYRPAPAFVFGFYSGNHWNHGWGNRWDHDRNNGRWNHGRH